MQQEHLLPADSSPAQTRAWLAAFWLSLLLTALATYFVWLDQRRSELSHFEQGIARLVTDITARVALCEQLLQSTTLTFGATPANTRSWNSHIDTLKLNSAFPEIMELRRMEDIDKQTAALHGYPVFDIPAQGIAFGHANDTSATTSTYLTAWLRVPASAMQAQHQPKQGLYARLDLQQLVNPILKRDAPWMQVSMMVGKHPATSTSDLRTRRKTAQLTLYGQPVAFAFSADPASLSSPMQRQLPYFILIAGMISSFSLLAVAWTRRRSLTLDVAAERRIDGVWYERAQAVAGFGSYSIRINDRSMRRLECWTPQIYRLLERAPTQGPMPTAEYVAHYVHPDDRDHVLEARERALMHNDTTAVEYRIVSAEGKVKHVYDYLEYRSTGGNERLFLGLLHDVSHHKQIEIERLESAAKFQAFTEQLGGIPYIGAIDDIGANIYASAEIQRLLGFSSEQWCTNPALRIRQLHDLDRDRVLDALNETISHQKPFSIDYRIHRSDGSLCWLHDEARIVTDASGKPLFLQGVLLDISERKQVQEDLERSHDELKKLIAALDAIREENQKRLAQEMHDDLGQLLGAMKMDLSDLQQYVPKHDVKIMLRLDSINDLVNAMITSVRRIVADLPPKILADLGLFNALALMIDNFEKRYQIPCRLDLPDEEPLVSPKTATTLYRIVQEALNNIVKHADASRVNVEINVSGRHLMLCIADNGKGIPAGNLQKTGSFGLIGMRERAATLNGIVKIESAKGAGTRICVTIPESALTESPTSLEG